MNATILLIEDEEHMREVLRDRLRAENYSIDLASDGMQGLEKASSAAYDLIILDIMLPKIDGFEVCRRIRQAGMATPILMLTARGQVEDKVAGLRIGADDYVTKPFEVRELAARIEVLLRRAAPQMEHRCYEFGMLRIDLAGTEVTLGGKPVNLSTREFHLLRYLVQHRGKTISREELLREVWGYSTDAYTRTVDVHIASLRNKLKINPDSAGLIQTFKGIGYKFVA
jgi:two-component system alkaline phosphatase synthesis response regulator PhoP